MSELLNKTPDDVPQWDSLAEVPFQGGETEKPSLNPEELRDTKKLAEYLEKMGVSQDILNNPAFLGRLDDDLSQSGIRQAMLLEANISENGTLLTLNGEYKGDEAGGTDNHDLSGMVLAVNPNGSLSIHSSSMDRERRRFDPNIFKKNGVVPDIVTDDAGYAEVEKYDNYSTYSEYSMVDGGGIVESRKIFMSQDIVAHDKAGRPFTATFDHLTEMKIDFGADGEEIFRKTVDYEAEESVISNMGSTLSSIYGQKGTFSSSRETSYDSRKRAKVE